MARSSREDYRFARQHPLAWWGALFTPTLRTSSSVLLRDQGFHPEVQDELWVWGSGGGRAARPPPQRAGQVRPGPLQPTAGGERGARSEIPSVLKSINKIEEPFLLPKRQNIISLPFLAGRGRSVSSSSSWSINSCACTRHTPKIAVVNTWLRPQIPKFDMANDTQRKPYWNS